LFNGDIMGLYVDIMASRMMAHNAAYSGWSGAMFCVRPVWSLTDEVKVLCRKSIVLKTDRYLTLMVGEWQGLNRKLNRPTLPAIKQAFITFYAIIKALDAHLKFVLVAGVFKFSLAPHPYGAPASP
jgi:hypothetical protein